MTRLLLASLLLSAGTVTASADAGTVYDNESVNVTWAMTDVDNPGAYTATPSDAFSTIAFDSGDTQITGTSNITDGSASTVTTGIKFKPSGSTTSLNWFVRPASGLTFTPTKITGYVNRCGTDAENGIKVTVMTADGSTSIDFGPWTALRSGKTSAQKSYDATAIYQYVIELTEEQQAKLAGADGIYVVSTVGVSSSKEGAFGEVSVDGYVSGTIADVAKYTLTTTSSPAEGGSISVYPNSETYLDGDEVTITATKNFGYNFINWTDKSGTVVSEEAKFTYTVSADAELTANFEAVNTYELAVTVEGGANDYQVSLSPAATVVDGKNMYEEGTTVTLTASSNNIITFNSWSSGETSSEISVKMTENKSYTATFSAVDFLAAWDFYLSGNKGRVADFATDGNEAAALILRDEDGNNYGWLDKSSSAGGYEGRYAGVNWQSSVAIGTCYWQTKVDASNYTSIKVTSAMVYNYNAYQKYNVQYSLDGETWTTLGTIYMEGAKKWTDLEVSLPDDANNQPAVYIRWIADKTSSIDGTSSSNDGIGIGAIYITGTEKLVDDGTAPALVSTVPSADSNTASANGKIVLTFDEKIQLTSSAVATLSDGASKLTLTPSVSGKTVICEYKGLSYSTDYTFSLSANSVSDLTDNVLTDAISIKFTTKTRPVIEKKLYDFVVPRDGTITEALAAANARGTSASERYRIFVMNGEYVFDTNGTTTGGDGNTYPDPRSYLTAPYVSFIGESMEGVIITNDTPDATWNNGYGNACPLEGIGKGDVLIINSTGSNAYFQNLTLKSSMGDAHGRDIVLNDGSNKTVFKDACLWGYQDTYVSNNSNGRFYFEGGVLRGRTDYLCGKGDVFYNEVTLQQCGEGGYLAVPSVPKTYGYIFNSCKIVKETDNVTYYLGRPWGKGTPIALFINTEVESAPIADGWAEMSGGWPARFAEYNTHLASGTVVDLSNRKTTFGDGYTDDPVLTAEEAATYTLSTVMGADDDWDPTELTEQASAPTNVKLEGSTLTWDNSDYVLLYAICKDGSVIDFTLENTYTVDDATAAYSVRAANEMGGLSEAVSADGTNTAISSAESSKEIRNLEFYNVMGQKIVKPSKGIVMVKTIYSDGTSKVEKVLMK